MDGPPSTAEMLLTEPARQVLVALAHRAVDAAAAGTPPPRADVSTLAGLDRQAGCFVTLYLGGQLKGCLGTFDAQKALPETVSEMAAAAATRDPRFSPVAPGDLPDISVSISVLSPLRPIESVDEIEVGRHGIEISRGFHRGVLLPQVAVEHGLARDEFLAETCLKAGLPPEAWRDPATRIRVFEAEVFGDPKTP